MPAAKSKGETAKIKAARISATGEPPAKAAPNAKAPATPSSPPKVAKASPTAGAAKATTGKPAKK